MSESGATPTFFPFSYDRKVVLKYSENRGAGAALSGQGRFIQAFAPNARLTLCWERFYCEPIWQALPCTAFVGNRIQVLGRESGNCEFFRFCARTSRSVVVCRNCRASGPTLVDYGR